MKPMMIGEGGSGLGVFEEEEEDGGGADEEDEKKANGRNVIYSESVSLELSTQANQ